MKLGYLNSGLVIFFFCKVAGCFLFLALFVFFTNQNISNSYVPLVEFCKRKKFNLREMAFC